MSGHNFRAEASVENHVQSCTHLGHHWTSCHTVHQLCTTHCPAPPNLTLTQSSHKNGARFPNQQLSVVLLGHLSTMALLVSYSPKGSHDVIHTLCAQLVMPLIFGEAFLLHLNSATSYENTNSISHWVLVKVNLTNSELKEISILCGGILNLKYWHCYSLNHSVHLYTLLFSHKNKPSRQIAREYIIITIKTKTQDSQTIYK